MNPHFDMGEIPAANLSANFVEPDPPADSQLSDDPVIASHRTTFSPFLIAVPIIPHEGVGEAKPFILAHIQVQPFQRSQAADAGALVISVDVGAVLAAPARVSVDASHHSRVSVGASDRLRSGLAALGSRN